VSLRALRSAVERQYRSENDGERNPASIQQPPPPPPQKNIKNAILVEIAHEIEEAINEAVEKNDSNTGSIRKITCSVKNKILKKHQASSNNLNYFTRVKTKVPSTNINAWPMMHPCMRCSRTDSTSKKS